MDFTFVGRSSYVTFSDLSKVVAIAALFGVEVEKHESEPTHCLVKNSTETSQIELSSYMIMTTAQTNPGLLEELEIDPDSFGTEDFDFMELMSRYLSENDVLCFQFVSSDEARAVSAWFEMVDARGVQHSQNMSTWLNQFAQEKYWKTLQW